MTSSVSALTYTYNNANELTSEKQDIAGAGDAKTVSYSRPNGLLKTLTYPDGNAITYDYTGRDQVKTINRRGAAIRLTITILMVIE